MNFNDRRSFLRGLTGVAGLVASGRAQTAGTRRPPAAPSQRRDTALRIRQETALSECHQPAADPVSNGDETSLPHYVASFSKGLPHTQLGEVEPGAYETLLYALSTGKQSDFESLD